MKQNIRIPYGYRILNGRPVVDDDEAAAIRTLFECYINGATIEQAAAYAHMPFGRSRTTHILRNQVYCCDSYYPPIIDVPIFERAQEIAASRNKRTGDKDTSKEIVQSVHTSFTWSNDPQTIPFAPSLTPSERAEAIYALIVPTVE